MTTVIDIINAEHNLDNENIECLHCHNAGEITFNQYIGDASCGFCGEWQLDKGVKNGKKPIRKHS